MRSGMCACDAAAVSCEVSLLFARYQAQASSEHETLRVGGGGWGGGEVRDCSLAASFLACT